MPLRSRFLELQALLAGHEAFWRPAPFHTARPAWIADAPALFAEVMALDEAGVERFIADDAACADWLAARLPVVAHLRAVSRVAELPVRVLPPCAEDFDEGIPARKRRQLEAFAAHTAASPVALVEWCAGKGHLGRRLALADGVPVTSLELDPALCTAAATLAARHGVAQRVVRGDALSGGTRGLVRGRTVVALHACGELHRTLVRGAATDGAAAYRIAPCCYHLGIDGAYRPLNRDARLRLDAGALRLAVTETVTAPARDRIRLARDQAWKLAFIALRNAVQGEAVRSFRPVPAAWLADRFEAFCRRLAAREGVALPAQVDWAHWAVVGEQRRAEVRRLELVRHAFRRALELWLVLDLALGLEERGFAVEVGAFCARELTPRNLLVVARHAEE